MVNKIKKLLNNLNNKYRLVIYNETTFEAEASYLLSKLNIALALSLVLVVGMMISLILLMYTPLKFYIPGFGDSGIRKQIRIIMADTEELSEALENNQHYVENLQQVLKGQIPAEKIYNPNLHIGDSGTHMPVDTVYQLTPQTPILSK